MPASIRYIGICLAEHIEAVREALAAIGYGPRCFTHELFNAALPPVGRDDDTPPAAYATDWATKGNNWPAIREAVDPYDVQWFAEGSLQARRASGKGLGRVKSLLGYQSRGETI